MRHLRDHRKLNRATDQRLALLRSLVASLFRHSKITTTLPKAKEARRMAERLITMARREHNQLSARREVLRYIPDPDLVKHLFDDLAPRFRTRPGGYTRITRVGLRRGDGAQLAVLELMA